MNKTELVSVTEVEHRFAVGDVVRCTENDDPVGFFDRTIVGLKNDDEGAPVYVVEWTDGTKWRDEMVDDVELLDAVSYLVKPETPAPKYEPGDLIEWSRGGYYWILGHGEGGYEVKSLAPGHRIYVEPTGRVDENSTLVGKKVQS